MKNNQYDSPILISDLPKEEQKVIKNALNNPSSCHLCGCVGIHACIGYPVIWTDDDKKRLHEALSKMFGWEKKDNE